MRVLLVEDDPALARALAINLTAHGIQPAVAATGREALEAAARFKPDVVVLDLGLPDMDGATVLEGIRGWSTVPVVVLSARLSGSQKVRLLDAGADDYVTKPFQMDEFLARVRAAGRRGSIGRQPEAPVFQTAAFTVDIAAGTVVRDGRQVRLTPTEFHLLEVLAAHAGKLVSQKQLLHEVWGAGYEHETHYLRVYMAQLRGKLEPDPAAPRHIITEPGLGYRLVP
jgi:two-component system, OmpR family, KDP operon response regulator KdpE